MSGVVLAGGAGRRMGRPKGPLPLSGRPLVVGAVDILRARCDYVVVSSREGVALPMLPAAVDVVVDHPGPDAPLAGIATALAHVPDGDVVVLACDMPFAGPAVDALVGVPAGVPVMAQANGHAQPLCARYPRAAALAAARRLLDSGDVRAMALARALDAITVEVPTNVVANLNTPGDLRRAERRLAFGAA